VVHRYAEEGRRGLADRSRAPHHSPHAIGPDTAELLCALRTAHPHWGARKLLLPRAIRTDNGVPFATQALHGLSYLNVWWMRLGIQHQRIQPGCPQQNGAHERMHRTLKRQAIRPVQRTCARQQVAFDAFRTEFNMVRPHEWLDQDTPASHYQPSPRAYPARIPVPTYPGHFVVKKVTTGGTFRFQRKLLYIANALVDQAIGLEETDDGAWAIYFNTVLLGTLNERDYIIRG
jgi:hypothetical protein